jgi:hypothetical protein
MYPLIEQLVTPVRYLKIQNRPKFYVDIAMPIAAAGVSTAVLIYTAADVVGGADSLVGRVTSALQDLSGFFLAALAAVATFQATGLDQPVLGITLDGKQIVRRRFLCYLFGYLTFASIVLLVVGWFAESITSLLMLLPPASLVYVRAACVFAYTAVVWSLFFTTLLGLHYLVERMHQQNPQVVPSNGPPNGEPSKATPIAEAARRRNRKRH